jgi:hypothetical protein
LSCCVSFKVQFLLKYTQQYEELKEKNKKKRLGAESI